MLQIFVWDNLGSVKIFWVAAFSILDGKTIE